jgi:hypothetical protein
MSIDELANSMTDALAAEAAAYAAVLELAEAQREALESNDLARIDRITAEQIEAVAAITRLGRERDTASTALGAELGLSPDASTLHLLVAALPPEERNAPNSIGERLRGIVGQIERVSERNKGMLVNGLRTSQFMLSQVLGSPAREPVYARDGRVDQSLEGGALEYRA